MKALQIAFCLLFLTLICTQVNAQQEHQYTQWMYNKLVINPAYAGSKEAPSLTALYRNQWMGFDGSPQSRLISFHMPFSNQRVGLGGAISNYTIGITSSWYASLAYSYAVPLNRTTALRFGIHGLIRNFRVDFSDPTVIVRDQDDPSFANGAAESKFLGNFGLGAYIQTEQFYFGASVPRFYPNEIGFNEFTNLQVAEELPHVYIMMGTVFKAGSNILIKPNLLVKYVRNAPFDMDLNVNTTFNSVFTLGATYRLGGDEGGPGESIDVLAMYQFNSLGFGLSYDIGLSNLAEHHNGSIEAVITYDFLKERNDMANPRYFF